MIQPSSKHLRSGFTLVEVVIASVILAIVLLSLGFFFANVIDQSTKVDNMSKALQYARQGLEEIRTQDITAMPLGRSGPEFLGDFDRYFEISMVDSLIMNAREVRCIVTWSSQYGLDSLSFSTIF